MNDVQAIREKIRQLTDLRKDQNSDPIGNAKTLKFLDVAIEKNNRSLVDLENQNNESN